MPNAINWFEIPANNFERACEFYENVMETKLQKMPTGEMPMEMALFHHEQTDVGGAIVKGEGYAPSAEGSVVYLNGGGDLSGPLSKVEAAGGKVLVPKTSIGENGFIAHFLDTEGNRVALHSMS